MSAKGETLYQVSGDNIYPTSKANLNLVEKIPPGNYIVQFNQLTNSFYLTRIHDFELPKKLYCNINEQADRILNTFHDRANTTGVLLVGEKGSGKSLLAKVISVKALKYGIPTIIINTPFTGDAFNQFIQAIHQECIITFDEFEKTYNSSFDDNGDVDAPSQEKILTLLDGMFPSKKLFLFTANNRYKINLHMINRPGRLFYNLEFTGIDNQFIKEYCEDRLNEKKYIRSIQEVRAMIREFNFDMLQSLVEEMNRYDESPMDALKMLNIKPSKENETYEVKMKKKAGYKIYPGHHSIGCNPLLNGASFYLTKKDGGNISMFLSYNDMISTDIENGIFQYEKDGFHFTLTKKNEREFNMTDYLDRERAF